MVTGKKVHHATEHNVFLDENQNEVHISDIGGGASGRQALSFENRITFAENNFDVGTVHATGYQTSSAQVNSNKTRYVCNLILIGRSG